MRKKTTDLTREAQDKLLSKRQLGGRWSVSGETIKRRTKEGLLHPVRFNSRLIRYRLSEILAIESEGCNGTLIEGGLSTAETARRKKLARRPDFSPKAPRVSKTSTAPNIGFH